LLSVKFALLKGATPVYVLSSKRIWLVKIRIYVIRLSHVISCLFNIMISTKLVDAQLHRKTHTFNKSLSNERPWGVNTASSIIWSAFLMWNVSWNIIMIYETLLLLIWLLSISITQLLIYNYNVCYNVVMLMCKKKLRVLSKY